MEGKGQASSSLDVAQVLKEKEEELEKLYKEIKVLKGTNLWLRKDVEIKEKEYNQQLEEAKENLSEKQRELDQVSQALANKDSEVAALQKTISSHEDQLQKMEDMKIELEELRQQIEASTSSGANGPLGSSINEALNVSDFLSISINGEDVGLIDEEEEEMEKAEEIEEGMKMFDEKLKSRLSPARKAERERRLSFMMAKYKANRGSVDGAQLDLDTSSEEADGLNTSLKEIIEGDYKYTNDIKSAELDSSKDSEDLNVLLQDKRRKLNEVTKELENKMGMLRGWEDTLKSVQRKVEKEEEKIINKVGEREGKIHELELKTGELRGQNTALLGQIENLKNDYENVKAQALKEARQTTNEEKRKEIEELQKRMEEENSIKASENNKLVKEIEELKEKLREQSKEAEKERSAEKEESERLLQEKQEELEGTKKRLNDTQELVEKLQEEVKKVKEEKEGVDRQLEEKQAELSRLESKDGEEDTKFAKLRKELEEIRQTNENNHNELNALKERLRRTEAQKRDKEKELAETEKFLKEKVPGLEKEMYQLQQGLVEAKAARGKYAEEVSMLKEVLEKRNKDAKKMQGVIDQLSVELGSVKEELFYSMAIAIKLNLSMRGIMCNQNIMALYETVQQNKIGYKDWNKWLHEKLNS